MSPDLADWSGTNLEVSLSYHLKKKDLKLQERPNMKTIAIVNAEMESS